MSTEIQIIITKLIKMRKHLLRISKSYRSAMQEREAIRHLEFYLATPRAQSQWKEFAKNQMERIQFVAPSNKSAESLINKLKTLIQ